MAINVTCPRCRTKFAMKTEWLDQQVQCQKCKTKFKVSRPPSQSPATPATPKSTTSKASLPPTHKQAAIPSRSGGMHLALSLFILLLIGGWIAARISAPNFLFPAKEKHAETADGGKKEETSQQIADSSTEPAKIDPVNPIAEVIDPDAKPKVVPDPKKLPELEPKKAPDPERKKEQPPKQAADPESEELPERLRPSLPNLPVFKAVEPLPIAEKASPLKRLQVLLVGDTNAKDYIDNMVANTTTVAQSVRVDIDHLNDLLTKTLGESAKIAILTGDHVTRNDVLNYYRNVPVEEGTGLVFYYSGHGAIERLSRQPLLGFDAGPMSRNELLLAMRKRNPAFIAVISDCCSSFINNPAMRPRAVGADPDSREFERGPNDYPEHVRKNLEDLLLKHRGLVDVTAAEPGKPASCTLNGGAFTIGFMSACLFPRHALDTNNDDFLNWTEAWKSIRTQTNFAHQGGPISRKPDQFAYAFHLPTDRKDDLMPPLRRLRNGVGMITIRNNTKKVIHYSLKHGVDGTVFIHELRPGHLWMHNVTMVDGRVDPPILSYPIVPFPTFAVTVELDYFIIESNLIRAIPELGTQYQFLSDATGKKIRLFTY